MSQSTEYKSAQRKISNRLSAQKSRMKIKQKIENLENKIKVLQNENMSLQLENTRLWDIMFPRTIICNEKVDDSFFSQL